MTDLREDLFPPPDGEKPDGLAWVIMAVGVVAIVLMTWIYAMMFPAFAEEATPEWDKPYVDEACAFDFACKGEPIYELVYADVVIPHPLGDMSKDECEKAKLEIQRASGALSELRCRPRIVSRQNL